jgi:hypothetical protein
VSAKTGVPAGILCAALVTGMLTSLPAGAALYKCEGADGGVTYQQTACPQHSSGGEVSVDTRSPGGAEAAAAKGGKDYSVESQLEAIESAREKERKARAAGAKGAAGKEARAPADTLDMAACAKHEAQSARWRDAIRGGYRTQHEREYQRKMLAHHQALVERYCPPE